MTVKFLGADDLLAGILAVSTDLGVTLSEDHADLEVTVIQREEDISAASISSSKAQILPRPSYQRDPDRIYGLPFAGFDILFTVREKTRVIADIQKIGLVLA